MTSYSESAVFRLTAKDAIQTVLSRYCQSIDGCGIELLKSVYWPDATDDHGNFRGKALDFVDFVIPFLKEGMDRTMHRMANVVIHFVDDARAKVQSYCMAYHEIAGQDVQVGTRFLDDFEQRNGEWRIIHRTVVMMWNQTRPTASDWSGESIFAPLTKGSRGGDDPSFAWFREPVGPRDQLVALPGER